jgi:hypothetical protein
MNTLSHSENQPPGIGFDPQGGYENTPDCFCYLQGFYLFSLNLSHCSGTLPFSFLLNLRSSNNMIPGIKTTFILFEET